MGLVYPGFGECHQNGKNMDDFGLRWRYADFCWDSSRDFALWMGASWTCRFGIDLHLLKTNQVQPGLVDHVTFEFVYGDDTILVLEGLHMSLKSSRNSLTIATKLVMSPRPSFHLHDSCHPFFFTKQEASREILNARCVSMVLETFWHEWIFWRKCRIGNRHFTVFSGKDCAFCNEGMMFPFAMWDSLPIYRTFWVLEVYCTPHGRKLPASQLLSPPCCKKIPIPDTAKQLDSCWLATVDATVTFRDTPPKFNMEPENKSLEKESPFGNHYFILFSGSMLNFGGVTWHWLLENVLGTQEACTSSIHSRGSISTRCREPSWIE